MRFRYDRHRRRLHIWNPPAEDVAAIRAEVQRQFDARDVAAIVFHDQPTIVFLTGRFLEILIFPNKKGQRADVLPFLSKVKESMSSPSRLDRHSEPNDEH